MVAPGRWVVGSLGDSDCDWKAAGRFVFAEEGICEGFERAVAVSVGAEVVLHSWEGAQIVRFSDRYHHKLVLEEGPQHAHEVRLSHLVQRLFPRLRRTDEEDNRVIGV